MEIGYDRLSDSNHYVRGVGRKRSILEAIRDQPPLSAESQRQALLLLFTAITQITLISCFFGLHKMANPFIALKALVSTLLIALERATKKRGRPTQSSLTPLTWFSNRTINRMVLLMIDGFLVSSNQSLVEPFYSCCTGDPGSIPISR